MGITLNSALVCDNSTLANFKAWASAISAFLQTSGSGLSQTTDTGQVNWGSIASVPTAGNYVYEIYKNTDALTNFYFKIEYGTGSSSGPNARIRVSIGTGTNGAGVLTGFIVPATSEPVNISDFSSPSNVTQYQCYFSGAPGRLSVLMWRDGINNSPMFFGFERSCDNSGNYNSTFITLIFGGNNGSTNRWAQQSIVFGSGRSTEITANSGTNGNLLVLKNNQVSSDLFAGNFAISPVFPSVGGFGNPHRICLVASFSDVTEGATYVIAAGNMPYGVSKTYIATKNGNAFNIPGQSNGNANSAFLSEYD